MNSAKYWRKRSLYAKQKQLDAEGEYEIAMRSRLKDLENEILKEADYFITRYAETNEISKKNAAEILSKIDTSKFDMTLKEFRAKAIAGGFEKELDSAYFKTRINRLQKLHAQLADLASKYAEIEEQRMALALAEQYKGTYELQEYHKYLVVGGLDIDFAHFDEQQLKDIVYQPWQGSDFSKRIWNNYTKVMPDVLTDVIARSVLMGYSHQRVEKMLRDRFRGIEDKNLHRLAVTEMGHAAEQATLEFYKDSNIDQYQYLATLESRTCDVCGHLDQKVFNVKDEKEGINYPLIHPYCRCTTVPYDPDLPDTPTRWSRDPITGKGKIIKNMSFSEWAEANGVKPLNKRKFLEAKPAIQGTKYIPISAIANTENSNTRILNKQLLYNDDGVERFIPKYAIIENIKVIAGKGTNREVHIAETLSQKFGFKTSEWKKCVGTIKSDKYLFDIHWFEAKEEYLYLPKIKSKRRRENES